MINARGNWLFIVRYLNLFAHWSTYMPVKRTVCQSANASLTKSPETRSLVLPPAGSLGSSHQLPGVRRAGDLVKLSNHNEVTRVGHTQKGIYQ